MMDLSYPPGSSVNDEIHKDTYCRQQIKLKYPSIDDMVKRVHELGFNCLLFKCDLSRFFHQIPCCPLDWSFLSMC